MGLLSLVFRFVCLKRIFSGLRNLQMLGSVSERNDSCLLHESVVLCKYKNWNCIECLFCALAAYRFRWIHFSWSCRQLTHVILQLFWLIKMLLMPSKIFHNHPFRFDVFSFTNGEFSLLSSSMIIRIMMALVGGSGCCHIVWKICSSRIAVKTWEHFKRESRLLEPVSLGAMAKCWDKCARNALNEAAQYQGGGNFNTSIGNWEYIPAQWKKLCGGNF